jgi:hypothetical protein
MSITTVDATHAATHTSQQFTSSRQESMKRFNASDSAFFSTISFIPSDDELTRMIDYGNDENLLTFDREKLTVLTKNPKAENGVGPSAAILKESPFYKHGYDVITNTKCKELGDQKKSAFAFIRDGGPSDKKFPFSTENPTMGLNGILLAFDKRYGEYRVNLFQKDKSAVHKLLQEFIAYRDKNAEDLFAATLEHMGNPSATNADNLAQYARFLMTLRKCSLKLRGDKTLTQIGIGFRSFCQSWDPKNGRPNFSIASPHFQTRVFINDENKFKKYLNPNNPDSPSSHAMIDVYNTQINALCEAFKKAGYVSAFVDLDGLLQQMNSSRDDLRPPFKSNE